MADFREQLIAVAAAAVPEMEDYPLFYEKGAKPPAYNRLNVLDTFGKFSGDFLPQCPIVDPLGRKIKIRKNNFPKFLNLTVVKGSPKKSSTIVELLETGEFVEEEYTWAKDRIQALFWVPDVLRDPDAIFKIKRGGEHLVKADTVYVKVYDKEGSKIKLVFVDHVGKYNDTIFITSYLTDAHTAVKYCLGRPIYKRTITKAS
jgi:hypothetical protein